MLTVTHICGHTQGTRIDELIDRVILKGLREKEYREPFIQQQKGFLERNLCPTCYCKEKENNPNLKPN